ncbi:MAG: MFS transporter [Clostridia bacterium]|nr:MFS transporter [Clostridia bacterium]
MKRNLTAYEKKAWQLVALCFIAYMTVYIGKKTISPCLKAMINEGIVDEGIGGVIGGCFLIVYAVGQLINGWLGDRVHPRYMITGGLFLAGAMNILMSLNSYAPLFIVIWGFCGFFCSMLWPPIVRAVSEWTTESIAKDSAAALSVTIPLGQILCLAIVALMLRISGWRAAFAVCGSILCVMAVVLYFLFGKLKEHMSASAPALSESAEKDGKTEKEHAAPALSAPIAAVFCVGIAFCAAGILSNGMLKDGLDYWIPTILENEFFHDASVASFVTTILPIVNIVGVYAAKWIYQKYKLSELAVCAATFAFSIVTLGGALVLLYTTSGAVAGIFFTVLVAMTTASMLGANSMLLTFIPLHFGKIGRASFVSGMLNACSYGAAALSTMVTGFLSHHFGWTGVVLMFWIAAAFGAVVCFVGRNSLQKKYSEMEQRSGESK